MKIWSCTKKSAMFISWRSTELQSGQIKARENNNPKLAQQSHRWVCIPSLNLHFQSQFCSRQDTESPPRSRWEDLCGRSLLPSEATAPQGTYRVELRSAQDGDCKEKYNLHSKPAIQKSFLLPTARKALFNVMSLLPVKFMVLFLVQFCHQQVQKFDYLLIWSRRSW